MEHSWPQAPELTQQREPRIESYCRSYSFSFFPDQSAPGPASTRVVYVMTPLVGSVNCKTNVPICPGCRVNGAVTYGLPAGSVAEVNPLALNSDASELRLSRTSAI